MVLLGLNQFIFVAHGEAGIEWQAGIATTLRVVLGLALLYAAVRPLAQRRRPGAQPVHRHDRALAPGRRGDAGRGDEVREPGAASHLRPAVRRRRADRRPARSGATRRCPKTNARVARERHRRIVSGELVEDHWEGERRAFDGRRLHLRFSAWKVDWDGVPAEQIVVTDDTAQPQRGADPAAPGHARRADRPAEPQRAAAAPARAVRQLRTDSNRSRWCCSTSTASSSSTMRTARRSATRCCARSPTRCTCRLKNSAAVMRLGEDEFALLAVASDAERAARELSQQVQNLLDAAARDGSATSSFSMSRWASRCTPTTHARPRGAAARRERRDARGQAHARHLAAVRRRALRARLGRDARRPSRHCAPASRATSSCSSTSRRSMRRAVRWSASRRWCAGTGRGSAASAPPSSFRRPNAPG